MIGKDTKKKSFTHKGKRFTVYYKTEEEMERKMEIKRLERDFELRQVDYSSPVLASCVVPTVIGDIGEMAAIYEFTKAGFVVSKPLTSNARYDLIAERGNKLFKVQVKTTKSPNASGTIPFRLKCYREGDKNPKPYMTEEVDAIFLHCIDALWSGLLIGEDAKEYPMSMQVKAQDRKILQFSEQVQKWMGEYHDYLNKDIEKLP